MTKIEDHIPVRNLFLLALRRMKRSDPWAVHGYGSSELNTLIKKVKDVGRQLELTDDEADTLEAALDSIDKVPEPTRREKSYLISGETLVKTIQMNPVMYVLGKIGSGKTFSTHEKKILRKIEEV